jgi:hypothetical protein
MGLLSLRRHRLLGVSPPDQVLDRLRPQAALATQMGEASLRIHFTGR